MRSHSPGAERAGAEAAHSHAGGLGEESRPRSARMQASVNGAMETGFYGEWKAHRQVSNRMLAVERRVEQHEQRLVWHGSAYQEGLRRLSMMGEELALVHQPVESSSPLARTNASSCRSARRRSRRPAPKCATSFFNAFPSLSWFRSPPVWYVPWMRDRLGCRSARWHSALRKLCCKFVAHEPPVSARQARGFGQFRRGGARRPDFGQGVAAIWFSARVRPMVALGA